MKKRLLALLLAGAMCVGLAACGNADKPSDSSKAPEVTNTSAPEDGDKELTIEEVWPSGTTVYIGAESSAFRVRIYDKALERGESGHWVRVELVMRGENAQAFGQKLTNAENVGKLAAQVINDKFSFIIRDDTNITRCTVCPWWQAFVDELESVRLVARETVQHCVEHIASWVEAQVGPSLAILFQTMGFPKIFELAVEASSRLSDKQRFLIADYNALYPLRA